MDFEDDGADRINELFEQCRILHRESYPTSSLDFDKMDLSGRLKLQPRAFARGSFADVYKGRLEDGTVVAVKVLRLPEYSEYNDKIYKTTLLRFFRELNYWGKLDHVNIARMFGFTFADGNIGLVSLWHQQGNLVQYIMNNPDASKHNLILDVAEGVKYLHTSPSPLLHGDLKAVNVLVDQSGVARLTDFGISRQKDDMNRVTGFTTTSGVAGTTPWTAPELLDGSPLAYPSDVYSFAGVVLEICCPGKTPYHYMANPQQMLLAKVNGELPLRTHYPEMDWHGALWHLLCACWEYNPLMRPDMVKIVQMLYIEFQLTPRVDQTIALRPLARCRLCHSLSPSDQAVKRSSGAPLDTDIPECPYFFPLCSIHLERGNLLALMVRTDGRSDRTGGVKEPQEIQQSTDLDTEDAITPSRKDIVDGISLASHMESHAVTAWIVDDGWAVLRLYFPWRGGIAEICHQDNSFIEIATNWVKWGFLSNDDFRVPERAKIAVVNTCDSDRPSISVFFLTADNMLCEWMHDRGKGWEIGLVHPVPNRSHETICAVTWQDGGINHRSVFYVEQGILKELTRADGESTWNVAEVGPMAAKDFTVLAAIENGQVVKRVFTSGKETMTFKESWNPRDVHEDKPIFEGYNLVGISIPPTHTSRRFYANQGAGQIVEYPDEDGDWSRYPIRSLGENVEPETPVSAVALSRGDDPWVYLIHAVDDVDEDLSATVFNGTWRGWTPRVKVVLK